MDVLTWVCVASLHFSGYKKRKEIRMSKILALKQDYTNYNLNNTPKKKIHQTPSFSAVPELPAEAEKFILGRAETVIEKHHRFSNPVFQFFNDTSGEIQNQLVNALFTTTLCPFVIAYNPFSKQDEKTRHYTAWRQPVSAIIAIGTSFPLTVLTNKFWNNLHNEGHTGFMDLRLSPTADKYKTPYKNIRKAAKAQGPEAYKAFLETWEPKELSEAIRNHKYYSWAKSWPSISYKSACLKNYVKIHQDARQALFTTIISADPKKLTADKGIIYLDGKPINPKKDLTPGKVGVSEELDLIPNMETTNDLQKYIQKHSLHHRKVSDLMRDKFKFKFYEEKDGALVGQFKQDVAKGKLSQVLAMDFLEKMGLIDRKEVNEADLLRAIMEHRQIEHAVELVKPFNNRLSEGQAIRVYALLGQDASRNIQMAIGEVLEKTETLSLGQFFHQIGIKVDDGSLQELMDMNMVKALEKFKEIFSGKKWEDGKLKGGQLKGYEKEIPLKDFAKRIIKLTSSDLGSIAKNDTKFAGIFFNLFITAFSCTVLNWAYPRFMEKFRPDLCADNNTQKGGNK